MTDASKLRAGLTLVWDRRLGRYDVRRLVYAGVTPALRSVTAAYFRDHVNELVERYPDTGDGEPAYLASAFLGDCDADHRDDNVRPLCPRRGHHQEEPREPRHLYRATAATGASLRRLAGARPRLPVAGSSVSPRVPMRVPFIAMRLSVSWIGLMCACGAAPVASRHVDLEPPPIADPLLAPVVLSIAHPATSYNEPYAGPRSTPLADAVRAAMQEAADTRGEVTSDARLDVVCRELATVVSRDAAPSAALVEFALRSHGVAEQAAHVFVAWTAPTPADVIAAMRPQFGDSLVGRMRAGVGTVGTGTGPTIAIVVQATGVDLVATPRAVAAHGAFDLAATLDPRVGAPRLIITRDDGAIEHPAFVVGDDGRTWHAPFACGEHTGRQWIEIDAEGLGGVLPRVLVPILCGSTWPSSFAIEPAANLARLTGPLDIERRLTSIINRQRARAGLPLVRSDARIARAARQRSASLREARAAGGAATTVSPIERLRAAGTVPLAVRESVLEVDSVGLAAEELMNDADYRVQLESPETTHIGIGVGGDDVHGHLFITITYAQFPLRIDAPAVTRCISDAIDAVGRSHVDSELSSVAKRYAEGLASGASHAQLWPGILAQLTTAARNRYKKISFATAKAMDVVEIDPGELVKGQWIDDVGVGVAQSLRDSPQGGMTWVVVFLAERHRSRRRFDLASSATTRRACLAAATGRSLRDPFSP